MSAHKIFLASLWQSINYVFRSSPHQSIFTFLSLPPCMCTIIHENMCAYLCLSVFSQYPVECLQALRNSVWLFKALLNWRFVCTLLNEAGHPRWGVPLETVGRLTAPTVGPVPQPLKLPATWQRPVLHHPGQLKLSCQDQTLYQHWVTECDWEIL